MGDSDDEYDRKRRDKFRGERAAEVSYRAAERVARPRDDWAERDAWSRPRPREYQRGVRDRGFSPSMEPAPKRIRHDYYAENYYNHYNSYHQAAHRAAFFREPAAPAPSEGGTPPMMSFKAFLATQDDNISESDAIEKYNDYKLEFQRQQLNEFFVAHKDDEWFRLKYHPEDSVKRKDEQMAALKKRVEVYLELLNSGKIESTSIDVAKTNDLLKLLDTVVIKLEGGNEEDLQRLEKEYTDMEEKHKEKEKAKEETVKASETTDKKALETAETSKTTAEDPPATKANGDAYEDGEEPEEKPESDDVKNDKENTLEKPEETKETNDADDAEKEDDKTPKSPSKQQNKEDEVVEKDKKEEKMEMDNDDDDKKSEKSTKSKEEDKKDSDKESDKEDGDKKTEKDAVKKEKKRKRSFSGSSSSSSSSSDSEDDEEVKSKKSEKDTEDKKKEEEEEEKVETIEEEEKVEKPQALHKTTSIFLRNLAPTITKQEVESICARYSGFLRVALADPQPDRRWLRRGWVTFKRDANIKEICWNLNNIRLRDCELGAIVNRDLSRRIRPINGVTAHKQIVRSDINIAAKVVLHLDNKAGLWPDEDESKSKSQTFGLKSNNPVLYNITDYLIEEASAEEEELLGLEPNSDNQDTTVVDRDDALVSVLDKIILYLRIVHSVDYYNHCEYPNEDEMPNRCGILHARGPPPTSKTDLTQFIGEPIETKMVNFLPEKKKGDNKNETKLINLSLKDVDTEIDKFVQANTRELAKDKWLCPLSGKKFKGPDFVRKHIFNKHGEKIEEVKKEVEFFNNYLKDPKRPMAQEATPTPAKREEPAPFAHPSYPSAFGGGGGYSRPLPYYNQGYAPRSRGYAPRGGRGYHGADSRPVIHYRDLDAPREPEEFI